MRRQILHLSGTFIILPILFLSLSNALKVLVILILLTLFASWYYEKRQLRGKYFKAMVEDMDLPEPDKKKWLDGANRFEVFERRLLSSFIRQFRRRKEKQPFFAIFSFFLAGTICLILFGQAIAIFAILTLGFGDSLSAIIGSKFGKNKILWNKDLSVEGSVAFFAAAAFAIYLFLLWQPQLAIVSVLATAIVASFVGMLVETTPTVNDNAIIPLAVGAALWLLTLL